jgi:hypothetical protein
MSTINRSRLSKGTAGVVALSLGLLAWSSAKAMPISIDLGSSPNITSYVGTTFSDLNGTQLQGQTLSLDFNFANGKFARLFSITNPTFELAITLQTSGSGVVGFLDGTGSLLDRSGQMLGSPVNLGSASGSDGSMIVLMFPLLSGQFSTPLDFFGVHTNLTLPNASSIMVTGGKFELISGTANSRDVFGIGPGVPRDIVPESGSTLMFFSLMLLILPAIYRRASLLFTV